MSSKLAATVLANGAIEKGDEAYSFEKASAEADNGWSSERCISRKW
jgi:hypothetical protein